MSASPLLSDLDEPTDHFSEVPKADLPPTNLSARSSARKAGSPNV
jgi:hypothetical protein